jgi:hypothetical protein
MENKIIYVVMSVLILGAVFLGFQIHTLKGRVDRAEGGVVKIINFINNQVELSKQK